MASDDGRRQWQVLKSRIERVVRLEPTNLELVGESLRWYRVANAEVLLTQATRDQSTPASEIDPFWAATWRAAQGLARFLQSRPLQNQHVLELGCGSGQAGVGAALAGAARVTLTDAVGLALLVAQLNSFPWRDRLTVRRLRWTQDRLPKLFPIVIGSDLVYDPHLFPMLEACARQHLTPGGSLLLSEPHRHTGDKFSHWIREAGWRLQEYDMDLRDGRIPIRIFECRLEDQQAIPTEI